jgi:D-alanine-D-alanine ligase-like ATP-grasp enzyme
LPNLISRRIELTQPIFAIETQGKGTQITIPAGQATTLRRQTCFDRRKLRPSLPALNAIVLADIDKSPLSELSAKQISEALAPDFPQFEIRQWTQAFSAPNRPSICNEVVFFARPFGPSANLVTTLRSLETAEIPYVGSDSNTCANALDQKTFAATLERNGIQISEDFFVDVGDDLDVFITEPPTIREPRRLFVTVLEDPKPSATPVLELSVSDDSSTQMYFADTVGRLRRAEIDEATTLSAQKLAVRVHELCRLRDLSRVTLVQTETGLAISRIVVNPLVTRSSIAASALAEASYAFDDVVWSLVCNSAARKYGTTDIGSRSTGVPSALLSAFDALPFTLDGIRLKSMEGFVQSLTCEKIEDQHTRKILRGWEAKALETAEKSVWPEDQVLHWGKNKMRRDGPEYQALLDRAFEKFFYQNAQFRDVLRASGCSVIRDRTREREPTKSVLTERELCRRLNRLRQIAHASS